MDRTFTENSRVSDIEVIREIPKENVLLLLDNGMEVDLSKVNILK